MWRDVTKSKLVVCNGGNHRQRQNWQKGRVLRTTSCFFGWFWPYKSVVCSICSWKSVWGWWQLFVVWVPALYVAVGCVLIRWRLATPWSLQNNKWSRAGPGKKMVFFVMKCGNSCENTKIWNIGTFCTLKAKRMDFFVLISIIRNKNF